MLKKMSYWTIALMLAFALAVPAQAGTTVNVKEDFAFPVFVSCANDGAGEVVMLSGTLHVVMGLTIDQNGGFHARTHFQPQRANGIGLITGDRFNAVGITRDNVNIGGDGLPFTFTFVNNFRLIGQGQAANLNVHETVHVTINANGDMTADVTNMKVTCE